MKVVLIEIIFFLLLISYTAIVYAQDIPVVAEQQLENLADAAEAETEDETWLQDMDHFKKYPLNLNNAEEDELKQLKILTDLQITNLLSYRKLLGTLINIYELQAIPGWDIQLIKKILPFITTALPVSLRDETRRRLRDGDHLLLLRISQVLERSKGFDKQSYGARYLGSPQRILFRYRYAYKNLLQFGLTGDKDAGEQFLKGAQRFGFDFYSFHFFARKAGKIQAIAIGDFLVSMGQGLIQWQGLAFKKNADVLNVKRQSAVLRPYNSAGEFNFHRGAGITIRTGKTETTAFLSFRKLDGNFVADTVNKEDFISSFLTAGYHRNTTENADRHNLLQTTTGTSIIFRERQWQLGINGVYYHFSLPIEKKQEPYNLYAISGNHWYNASIDYSFTHKNVHFFGEAAIDKRGNKAFIDGLLLSVDARVDISVILRILDKSYESLNANAFTENTVPGNETGYYTGIIIRPATNWRIDLYGDTYQFPWLKYQVDAPSRGSDYLVQLIYTPDKQTEIYTRFRTETKQANMTRNRSVANFLVAIPRQSWRSQIVYKISHSLAFRNRIELLWFDRKGTNPEKGFLSFFDIIYRPPKAYSAILRIQCFESNGYNSRLYAYENDILYSYSIPAFYGKGFRYYFTLSYDLSKKISAWARWSQTIYREGDSIGSGLDQIEGNQKTEVKLQIRYQF